MATAQQKYRTVDEIRRARKQIILIHHAIESAQNAKIKFLKEWEKDLLSHLLHAKKCNIDKCDVSLGVGGNCLCKCEELKMLIDHMNTCKNYNQCHVCSVFKLLRK